MNNIVGHNAPEGDVPDFKPPKPKLKKPKYYPLDVNNWGDDSYMLVSKGHHNIELFKTECLKEYQNIAEHLKHCECPCEQLWYKAIPSKDCYSSYYVPVWEDARGAIPITVWWE